MTVEDKDQQDVFLLEYLKQMKKLQVHKLLLHFWRVLCSPRTFDLLRDELRNIHMEFKKEHADDVNRILVAAYRKAKPSTTTPGGPETETPVDGEILALQGEKMLEVD